VGYPEKILSKSRSSLPLASEILIFSIILPSAGIFYLDAFFKSYKGVFSVLI
jgi:hypothetical protein